MKAMEFGTTTWSLVNARLVTRWRSCLSKQSEALLRVNKTLNQSDDNHNIWSVRLRSSAYHSTVWSPKRKQHPEFNASQTSLCTMRKMSETLSESSNNKKTVTTIQTSSVGHNDIPVAESAPEPLLTASQEEHILNELSIEQSNTQQTVDNFYDCPFNF